MSVTNADQELINWVQRQINTGVRRIVMPGHLLTGASGECIDETLFDKMRIVTKCLLVTAAVFFAGAFL